MPPEQGALGKVLKDVLGHRNVGQQHELFDQAVRLEHRLRHHVDRVVRLAAHLEPDLGTRQQQSPATQNKSQSQPTKIPANTIANTIHINHIQASQPSSRSVKG